MAELPITDEDTDSIVYGRVIKSEVFVNGRKRHLYTDFTVQVESILKPVGQNASGSKISVLRLGGLAKLPSGGTIEDEVRGDGPDPGVGSLYLFFLKRLPDPANAYTYLKFWNVVPQADGSAVVKAAFDQDVIEAKKKHRSLMESPLLM